MPVRVVVADSDPLIAEGLARGLEGPRASARAVTTAAEALEVCAELRPCVLLAGEAVFERLDLRRFVELADFGRAVQTLVVGTAPDPCRALRYLRLGCMGYLSRRDSLDTVQKAVLAVASGEMWARRAVVVLFVQELLEGRAGAPRLSSRQREILDLIHRGCTNEQISDLLYISPETLRWHVRRLFRSIGARDRAGAAEFARRHFLTGGFADLVGASHRFSPALVEKNQLA